MDTDTPFGVAFEDIRSQLSDESEDSAEKTEDGDKDSDSVSSGESIEVISDPESEEDAEVALISESVTTIDSDDSASISPTDREETDALGSSGYLVTPAVEKGSDSGEDAKSETETRSSSTSDSDDLSAQIDMFMKPIGDAMLESAVNEEFPNTTDGGGDVTSSQRGEPSDTTTIVSVKNQAGTETVVVEEIGNVSDWEDDDDVDDDVEDETIAERLWGLTEMFPDRVRSGTNSLFNFSINSANFIYVKGRKTLWVVVTSFIILWLPIGIEVEKIQMDKEKLDEAQDILIGQKEPPMPTIPSTSRK